MNETRHAADRHDLIEVFGARENNLKNVSVEIPKRRLTVFTGVSGSGKSSLVFGTIAAESQRLINETYTAFVQSFMPSLGRPEVDGLTGLTTAIIVDQERMGANARSTVGTATDANAMLRILYSRLAEPNLGPSFRYGFNSPEGMCPRCEGLGEVNDIDIDELVDRSLSLEQGAIRVPGYTPDGWYVRIYTESGFVNGTKKISDFTAQELDDFLYRPAAKVTIANTNMTYEGLVPKVQRSMLSKDRDSMQPHIRAFVDRAVTFTTCPDCGGTRLNPKVRGSTIDGRSIADCTGMQISDLAMFVRGIGEASVAPIVDTLSQTLESFVEIGLGYLSLDRRSSTLSGGEAQRVKMVRHLGSSLTDVTYVFDEPTVGLHPHDIQRMNGLLLRLRDKGNTVLVVEHKPETIGIADYVVDLGPGAGAGGGEICFTGTVEGLRASLTLTGRHLGDRTRLREATRPVGPVLEIRGATRHNLQNVDVDVPLGILTVVTGVAGSGKSSLIHGSIPRGANVVSVDQTPIRGSRRSNPATYTGLLEPIRTAFAKVNKVKPALFSANSTGACPNCNGAGVIYTDLAMMAGVATVCEECGGARFQAQVLEYRLGGRNIAEVLAMSVGEAEAFFAAAGAGAAVGAGAADAAQAGAGAAAKAAHAILERMRDVGLGYLSLGQPLTTLSGGERQRLKLAIHMAEKGGIYVLDEPTSGLHLADVEQLLALLDRLVESGKSVIVIEHHQAVMAHADWIIDIGPGAGHDGGRVVFEGTPADLVAARSTLTGIHLAEYVGAS
ncbi:daunorubicin resistance protein DrrC [Subtercola sp. Z020]|uniref:ATP-binding cassette domain-containing protein n=1 Tax=Subtercola sp. Z020 TaxID=2080582 RepID=UPI000CE90354|nr:excinuclease ABC subunit UvrA [Subtercola sp. Z020]PPF78904.1 daunorubicin resistance protein DrrC [Subtercola sp. Z020]